MFLKRIPNLLRTTGNFVRFKTTCQMIQRSKTIPSFLISTHTPIVSQPSLIRPLKKSILDLPIPISSIISDKPCSIIPLEDKIKTDIIEDPTKVIEQKAARLIVIRRRKMKRHKLKKLRIKMKFLWAKVRQRREMKKEKAFQAELMGHIREAEKFDAALYAKQKIEKANEVLLPKLWKGKRLPEFVIRQLLAEQELKKQRNKENLERRKKIKAKVSDYNL